MHSFRLAAKVRSKSLLTASSNLNPPLDLKTVAGVHTSTTTTITTTILSITPATSLESTLERIKDGHRLCPSNCKTPPSQMSKAGAGQQQSLLRVQNHQNSIPPFEPPLRTKKPDTNSSSAHFDSNELVPSSNESNPTICTISTTTSKISSGSKKDVKEAMSVSHQAPVGRETPMFNHVSPIVNPMLVSGPFLSPFFNPSLPTLTPAPNPVTRIGSSSSKVSDV